MRFLLLTALLAAFPDADTAAVKNTLDEYVRAWLANDPAAVMRQLTPDSVLVPGDKNPYTGADAIRNYWWPPNAPSFTLTRFDTTIEQLAGSGDVAVVRGTQVIEWTSGKERWRTRGNYLCVLRRTKAGWKIAMQMAANGANERLE